MKRITISLAIMVATMAISCQNDDGISGSSESKPQADAAYVSISINTPQGKAASSESDDGTSPESNIAEENKIFSLALLAFDRNYDYIDAYPAYVSDDGNFDCKVAPDARRFLAVVNPNEEIWAEINEVSSLSQASFSSRPAIEMTAASVSTENYKDGNAANDTRGFTMVNCGSKNTDGILLEALVSIDTELSDDPDLATPLEITVDRLVAKFEFFVNTNFESNTSNKFGDSPAGSAEGKVLGVALTATNKAAFLYSEILTDKLANKNVYRTDHNMAVGQSLSDAENIIDVLEKNFNWVKNGVENTSDAFVEPNATLGSVNENPFYVHENTCMPSYSNSNNLTQAIVKAQYNPTLTNGTKPDLGTSWFKIYNTTGNGTYYLTFDEVVDLYSDRYPDTTNPYILSTDDKASMDAQLRNIMGNETITWDDPDLEIGDLNTRPEGGYKAATVKPEYKYIVQFYQNAINYYDIFIQHDDSQPVGHEGRWGMVRNNSYTMDITGIMKEGLPYIPDPTDPDIIDPENPDPEDPEPADKLNTYIEVKITAKPWVIWYQESPLM